MIALATQILWTMLAKHYLYINREQNPIAAIVQSPSP
jgi:hypothetical protein